MSIDCRTRLHKDFRTDLSRDEVFDALLPDAAERNGALAARGLRYKGLPALTLEVDGRSLTLRDDGDAIVASPDADPDATLAQLSGDGLTNLVQDKQTTMGLAMTSKVKIARGRFESWIGWEPVFRALLDARPVHEAGAIVLRERDGNPLDTTKRFRLGDDRADLSHFLHEAGFLHIEGVFDDAEMAEVARDLDAAIARARADDGASWWAGDSKGVQQAVRVLWFHEQSPALQRLLADDRIGWIADATGDCHDVSKLGAEGLVKPLDIQTGLSDLPWHKDCGQGGHSYICNGLTIGISVTGADEKSGALGVVPGAHRANVQTAGRDDSLDIAPIKLVTRTGDLTVHCSDMLHRAHRPTERPRKVVYTGVRLGALPGDELPKAPRREERAARAQLTDVRDRIAASGGDAKA